MIDPKKGWGFRNETFHLLQRLAVFGRANWFNLGDRDLATHIHRTAMLAEGKSLTDAAESIRAALGVKSRILPMANEPVPTIIDSSEGPLHFQEYLVKRRAEPVVRGIRFDHVEKAKPAPGVLESIRDADRIVICPSNPLISIGPILAVRRNPRSAPRAPQGCGRCLPNRRRQLAERPVGQNARATRPRSFRRRCRQALRRLHRAHSSSIPSTNRNRATIESLGMKVVVTPTVMQTRAQKRKLARTLG